MTTMKKIQQMKKEENSEENEKESKEVTIKLMVLRFFLHNLKKRNNKWFNTIICWRRDKNTSRVTIICKRSWICRKNTKFWGIACRV